MRIHYERGDARNHMPGSIGIFLQTPILPTPFRDDSQGEEVLLLTEIDMSD